MFPPPSPAFPFHGAFELRPVPAIRYGAGRAAETGAAARDLAPAATTVALVVDPALHELGVDRPVLASLAEAGAEVAVFAELGGEPKQKQLEAATDFVRSHSAGLVVCLGGGSAMDVGKVAAAIALTEHGPADFAMDGLPLPKPGLPKICLPTTAGTGSELSSTNIFTRSDGKKVWVWGTETKPDLVLLDPELTVSLPPRLTAWTGLDAFTHALEACTNRRRHPANDLYAHRALALVAAWLETAVRGPADVAARGGMLLASAYAGIAIDNCSTGMAHNISHAIAALAPIHHGLATGLGLEAVLGWEVEAAEPDGPFAAAAEACGLGRDARALVDWYGDLIDRCGVERRLPPAFQAFAAEDLEREMLAPETQYMRQVTAREVSDADIARFAARMMAMA